MGLLEGKKVCGILIENIIDNPNYFYSTIGVGLNLSIPNRLLNIIDGNPGNLKINSSQAGVLLRDIIKSIFRNISRLKDKGPNSFVELINNYKLNDFWMNTNLMCISEKSSSVLNKIKWKKIFIFSPGEEEFLLYKI